MTIGSWDPETHTSQASTLKAGDVELAPFITIGQSDDIHSAIQNLETKTVEAIAPLMKQERSFWHEAVNALPADAIINLIRFFTVAEESYGQLQAGNNSPVIALNQVLKKRDEPLDKSILVWIKENSSNRFLPNGAIL